VGVEVGFADHLAATGSCCFDPFRAFGNDCRQPNALLINKMSLTSTLRVDIDDGYWILASW